MVLQLNAETDTIIEYVSLYREQRGALAQKEKKREDEIRTLSQSKHDIQERVNELELLLKSTVQSNKLPQQSKQAAKNLKKKVEIDDVEEENSDSKTEELVEEFEIVEGKNFRNLKITFL